MYKTHRHMWCRFAGRLIEGVTCSDDDLDADRLEALRKTGERASLASMSGDAGVRFVDGFIAYRRAHGTSESTIGKNRGTMRSAFALAKRAGLWRGDLDVMFERGFDIDYKPRRVRITHDDARRLLEYFDELPHHKAQIAFSLATGAEPRAIHRAHRTDLDATPIPLHGTKTDDRERSCFRVLPWQEEYLKIAKAGMDGAKGMAFTKWHNSVRDIAAACADLEVPRLSLQSCRHVFMAWARDDGIPSDLVAMALGHRDTRMIMLTYDSRDGAGIQRRALEQAQQRAQLRVIEGGKTTSRKNKSSA
jgi:integrase